MVNLSRYEEYTLFRLASEIDDLSCLVLDGKVNIPFLHVGIINVFIEKLEFIRNEILYKENSGVNQ